MHAFDDDRTNLWFLLSIAPLTLGCPGDDAVGGDGSSGASSSGTTTMTSLTSMGPGPVSTTSGADGTGGSTGGSTSAATSSTGGSSSSGMPGESSSSSEATSSTGGSESTGGSGSSGSSGSTGGSGSSGGSSGSSGGSSESSGGSTGPALTPCEAYGATVSYCYDPAEGAYAEMYCDQYQMYLAMNYGPACVAAFEDFIVCLSALTCPEFMGGMPVCVAEDAAFLAAC